MKKRICLFLCAGLLAVSLTGCGGEYVGTPEGNAVSDSVVSGSAVKDEGTKDLLSGNYTYCNDQYVYYTDVDALIGRRLDTGEETAVKIENIEDVCYADNDWVYYTKRSREDEFWEEAWRIPLKKDGEWRLDESAKECILQEKEGFDDPQGALCDGSYIVYITGETYQYRQYNIEKKAYDKCKALENRDDYSGSVFILCNGAVFIDYVDLGLVCKRLDHDAVENLTLGEQEEVWGYVTATDTEIFFGSNSLLDGEPYREGSGIWRYTYLGTAEGELHKIIERSDIETVLKEEGLLSCPVSKKHKHTFMEEGMFVSGNRLYLQIFIYSEDKEGSKEEKCRNMVVLSRENRLDQKDLRYEKQLSACLENVDGGQKAVTKFMPGSGVAFYEEEVYYQSRGLLVTMLENKCLMYVEDPEKKKNRWACYDLSTGKFKYITEKDNEWYLRYYDSHHSMLQGRTKDDPVDLYMNDYHEFLYMMPNNYDF
ncbi:MAG: hypothetical protein NC293_01605 [Roseburia sp.]|nr:hypothetical protein [Roseburia sp.]